MTLALLVFLLASSVALWSADAPPKVDRHDAAAVARAYAAAVKAGDTAAATALMTDDPGARQVVAMMGQRQQRVMPTETMLLPTYMPSQVEVGAATPGDKGAQVFDLHRTIDTHTKLVLVPQPDGTWLVDLRASFVASTAPQPSPYAAMMDRLASRPTIGPAPPGAPEQRPWECVQKLQQLTQALLAYAEEHDDRLPLAAVWQDAITPYMEGDKPFVCPSHPTEECSYAFNATLSEKTLPGDWQQRQEMILLACTGGDNPNAVFTPADLKTLKGRHGAYNAVAFANGNAMALPVGMTWDDIMAAQKSAGVCMDRLRSLVKAARTFAKDHDSRLPAAATWCDDLQPLLTGESPFTCPDSPKADCCYAINRALAGKSLKELINHRKLVLFTEVGPTTRNAVFDAGQTFPGRHRVQWQVEQLIYFEAHLNGAVQPVPARQP